MKQFILGLIVGSALTGGIVGAGSMYDSKGQPAAPRGSIQEFDYYRQRQQFLDVQALRREADRARTERVPCAK